MIPSASPAIPPNHVQVLIVGGGPAGSYAASVLAREGISVAVLESAKFPRYHVGESLIPSIRHYMRFIGADEKIASYGFVHKPGSAMKFNQFKREGYTDFVALGHDNNAWNVVRAEFDQLLLEHARSCGAMVFEQTKVTDLGFSPVDDTKPVAAHWTHCYPGHDTSTTQSIKGCTSFDYLIDASGRSGIMSTKYMKNRSFVESLRNVAVWGYWRNTGMYGKGTAREGAPWFEALTDETGWAWFIPLHNGTTSVGVVINKAAYQSKYNSPPFTRRSSSHEVPDSSSLADRYVSALNVAPGVLKLLGPTGTLDRSSVKSASDYSYCASDYAGNGFRVVGDAGCFIDPFFSSGIHLALTSALSAAATICAEIRGDCDCLTAQRWHSSRVAVSYTRFQIVVLSAYKQIRSQSMSVLSDVNEDNFDRAFDFLRPIIQGASEVGQRLSETELQVSLDFCVNLFNPTSPEQHARLAKDGRFGKHLLDVTQPVSDPAVFDTALFPSSAGKRSNYASEEDDRMVLKKINARRVVHAEYAINNMELEALNGYAVRLECGRLGLLPTTG